MPNQVKSAKASSPIESFGRYWWLVYSLVALIAGLIFSCTPVLIDSMPIELPPAYLLKSQNPFADTAPLTIPEHPGDRSHGAKLTPRIVGSMALWATSKLGLHPYWPASIGGWLFLICGVVTTYRLTNDKLASLACGCLFAGLYTLSGCLSLNGDPKPFDGVAVGLISLASLSLSRPIPLGLSAFLACWTDERAILSCLLIGFLVFVAKSVSPEERTKAYCIMSAAVLGYIVTRFIASFAFGWTKPDTSLLGENIVYAFGFVQVAAWICFEGAWLLIVASLASADPAISKLEKSVFAGLLVLTLVSCLLVLDVSRATMFCFPLIFAAIAMLSRTPDGTNGFLRRMIAAAACVSLIAGNFDFILGLAYTPLTSLSMFQWLRFFGSGS